MKSNENSNASSKDPLVILTGPTGAGKTALSIELAKRIRGEVISADSMQVYRGMDIGTAKIRPEEMRGVSHHLIDVLDPSESFDVVRFVQMAETAVREIRERGRIPIVVGGTGFYIQALRYGVDFSESGTDPDFRKSLEETARRDGPQCLHRQLEELDPDAAAEIHPHNVRRVIRALEFYHCSGQPISEHNRRMRTQPDRYNSACFVLTDERSRLYARIDARVDRMMEEGLLEEVQRLYNAGYRRGLTSMQGLGYKELLDVLEGLTDPEEAVRIIKRDSRHFAKRQLTWFARERDVIWLSREFLPDTPGQLRFVEEELKTRGIFTDTLQIG